MSNPPSMRARVLGAATVAVLIMAVVAPVMIAIGAFASQACFELEVTTGALQYGAYLATIVILRLIMNLDPRWNFPLM